MDFDNFNRRGMPNVYNERPLFNPYFERLLKDIKNELDLKEESLKQ